MQTKIDKFEINFLEYSQKCQQNEENKTKKPQNDSKEKEFPEIFQISDQMEFSHSNNVLPTERKSSHDSISICASQAETLSQTSESSFFLSYTSHNSQPTSSNELIQLEKKSNENIPFYHGIEEYFQNLMPERFIDYTKTKNYIHKNIYLKKYVRKYSETKNTKSNMSYEDIPIKNCFYFPVYYCPMNSFYFNNFSKVIINNYNNEPKKENNKLSKNREEENEGIKTDKKKDEKNEEQKEEEKMEKIEILTPKRNKEKSSNNTYYNSRRYQDYKKKTYYNNNQKYNRHYNKYSNYYYDNEYYQEGRPSYYYNNTFYKRRNQNPFENKFYFYK